MKKDFSFLTTFEEGLVPWDISASATPVNVLGYGEISTVFRLAQDEEWAFKRMPLFDTREAAETYLGHYETYCAYLTEAGLRLPESFGHIVELPGRPVVLYLVQQSLPPERFCHKLIKTAAAEENREMIAAIVAALEKIWAFNGDHLPDLEIAIDGQLSNWVWLNNNGVNELLYIDTSTPLYRRRGTEQLDPELFLKSAPSFLRWLIRWQFLDEVMERYYLRREVYTDLAANCFKEQAEEWIQPIIDIANRYLDSPLTFDAVHKYYKNDKIIWALFLALRKMDRWLQRRIFRRRYEYILPEIEHR